MICCIVEHYVTPMLIYREMAVLRHLKTTSTHLFSYSIKNTRQQIDTHMCFCESHVSPLASQRHSEKVVAIIVYALLAPCLIYNTSQATFEHANANITESTKYFIFEFIYVLCVFLKNPPYIF